ncbi:hypothetical protein FQA39_LY05071 [Lamprigera yunnana]|nr:hypothetical protein FQA39_LY05071 [Lamprigera yunnana]
MGVTVLQQFPIVENRTGPLTIDLLTKRISALGATQQGQFLVDCETYTSVPQLANQRTVHVLHNSEQPATVFSILETGTKTIPLATDGLFDLLMMKMNNFYSSKKQTKAESKGPRFEIGDFLVKLGSVTVSQNFKGVLVEVEYKPCVVPAMCWELMREFLQGEQLQRLAVPQTDRLQKDRKHVSILFDPKEAANIRKDTIYQIGVDGLEELKERNEKFAQFENTLFHETSKHFERSVETIEANRKLDKTIRRFLYMLSPHFLFNCSYKALEWLVCRYHIHEYNKEDLLMLILPYHETNIFVRILQLMNLKNPNDKWYWLKSLQRSGIHLPKQALYNNASSNMYLLECISNYIINIVNEHQERIALVTVLNFCCSTFVGSLEYCEKIDEIHVSKMLPVLLKGFSSDIPDFAASSYIICAQLFIKIELSDNILEKLIEKICIMKVAKLKSEAILLLIVLFQSQKHCAIITPTALKYLASHVEFVNVLQRFNHEGLNVYPLLSSVLTSVLKMILWNTDSEIYKHFLTMIFNTVKFDNSFVPALLTLSLEVCGQKKKCVKEKIQWFKEYLYSIEKQHPVAYDKAIKDILKPSLKRTLTQKVLSKLLGDISNVHSIYDLMEKLYHSNSKQRVGAVKLLNKELDVFKEKDIKIIESAVYDRLNDDSVTVVFETLKEFKHNFLEVINMTLLKKSLLNLLNKCRHNIQKWAKILPLVLNLICDYYEETDTLVFISLLPFLLPKNLRELEVAKQIISNSNYTNKSQFLSPLLSKLKKVTDAAQFATIIYNNITKCNLFQVTDLVNLLKQASEINWDPLLKYMALLILCSAIPHSSNFALGCSILEVFEMYMTNKIVVAKSESSVLEFIVLAKQNKLTLQCLLDCLKNLILNISNINLEPHLDFSINNDMVNFMLRILKLLLPGTQSSKQLKSSLYANTLKIVWKHFKLENATITFLMNIVISDNEIIDEDLRKYCLKTIIALPPPPSLDTVVIAYLLAGLSLPDADMRAAVMEIVTNFNTNNRNEFLTHLSAYHNEVLLDHEQLSTIYANIFEKTRSSDLNISDILSQNLPIYLKSAVVTLVLSVGEPKYYKAAVQLAVEILETQHDNKAFTLAESKIIEKTVEAFNVSIANIVEKNSDIWKFIVLGISNDKSILTLTGGKLTCPSVIILERISREYFSKLKHDLQVTLLDIIIEIAINSENVEVYQAVCHIFKRIDLDSLLVLEQLQKMRDVRSSTEKSAKVKRRVNTVPTADILDTNSWKKGVIVLEFIQDKKKIRNIPRLLSVLFEILKKCLDFEEQANVEYPKQLLLSTIFHCCQKISNEEVPESSINLQLVVQCIRASQNPQTHHHALLLLAKIASIFPKQVLHHIIAIFTFMGSSVLRHDDEYSFQIITKIIDTIIPILINDGTPYSIAIVLRVFIDAILDIPEHRRMRLFKQLLTQLSAKENLCIFLFIVFESQVVHEHLEKQKMNKNRTLTGIDDAPKRLDVASDLCREFSPDVVIVTCIKVLLYLCKLPEEKTYTTQNVNDYTFDIQRYTAKQLRHYKYIMIMFISNLLSSKQFVMQVAALSDEEMLPLEPLFKETIIIILNYIQMVTKLAENNVYTPQAQYWKVILHYSCDILDAVNALLTEKMFMLVIRGLMVYSLSSIRRRALDLLNNKLQHNTNFINECDKIELYKLITAPLVNIVKTIEEPQVDTDQEQVVQKALVSLKLLVKQLASGDPEKFMPILELMVDLMQTVYKKVNENVLASLILCIAELCNTLRAHAICSLHKCMPVLLKFLKPNKEDMPSLLLTSVVASIHKILESLALFLSPFLKKLLCGISEIAAKWGANNDQRLALFLIKLDNIQQKLGKTIPLRVLLPAVEESYTVLINKEKFNVIEQLMKVLCESLSLLKGGNIENHLIDLTNFFLRALQFRAENQYANVDEIEENIIKAISTLVLKLSETTFRPLYYRIFDWAIRTNVKTERVITFYNLSHMIANSLKGLFSLFAGHIINNAAKLLNACNAINSEQLYFQEDVKNIELLNNILKTLHTLFLYDSQKFINKERFEVLMQPIVDQLENTLGGIQSLENRATTILTPCLVQFAVAIADDSLWKQMNYQVLLKTRHNDPKIRLIALQTIGETAKKLGEDFLPLVPETIPFLAELLEDEEEVVEKSCQKMLQELEKVLGEPLQKYF